MRMAMRVSMCSLVGLIALLATTGNAVAVVLVYDQFVQDGALSGKVPSPGPGPAWNPGAQTGVNAVTVAGGEVVLQQTDPTNSEDIANVFGDQPGTATTYARFDFRLPSAENTTLATDTDILTEGLFFATLRGSSASTSQRGRVGFVPPATSGYRMAINADSGNLVAGAVFPLDLAFDTTYRAVFSYDASTVKSKLWINPVDVNSSSVEHAGDPLNPNNLNTVMNRIILRQHNTYVGKEFVDNVVVATSFAEALNPIGPGDFNGDGNVDAADYATWRKDPSGFDGDPAGYVKWRSNFDNAAAAAGGLSGPSLVPEPATAALLTCFCVFGVLPRPRRIHVPC